MTSVTLGDEMLGRSGMDPDLRKSIMGHWWRNKSVDEGYDLFDDEDRVEAIDKMSYDHGETRILTPKKKKGSQEEICGVQKGYTFQTGRDS